MVNFSKRKRVAELTKRELLTRVIIAIAVIAFVVCGWAWWHYVHSNPTRVFWGAVDNAFQTNSFSRQTIQGATGQSFNQKVVVTTAPKQIAAGTNQVIQTGDGAFNVITSIVGTPYADYVRYDYINTDQKNTNGKAKDFSSVTKVWGQSKNNQVTNGQLYNQSVLGVVPFANLTLAQRSQLTNFIQTQHVYQPNLATVKKIIANGRPTYVYDVKVNAEPYISLLKQYASMVGLNQLAQTNPADYKDTAPLSFQFVIDAWTQQVSRIRYSSSVREEIYGSQGAKNVTQNEPKQFIPIQELQQRVQSIE